MKKYISHEAYASLESEGLTYFVQFIFLYFAHFVLFYWIYLHL